MSESSSQFLLVLMDQVKKGVVLVRETSSGQWIQRGIRFDPSQASIFLTDPSRDEETMYRIPDRRKFMVRPSPYLIPNYPQAVALHLYPTMQGGGDAGEETDLHISSLDRRDIQEWSYSLQSWVVSNDDEQDHQPMIPNLSEKEESLSENLLYAAASSSSPPQSVLIDKFNIPITRRTLQCLRDNEWLSDEVVNFYFSLLQEKAGDARKIFCWNSFFYSKLTSSGYAGVRNWTSRKNIDLFDQDQVAIVLIPVHVVDHWALGVVDMQNQTTQYLDSLGGDSIDFHSNILAYLHAEFLKKSAPEESTWGTWSRKERIPDLPLQSNGSDCGVFICMYALALASGSDLKSATADRVPVMRRRMACDILRGRIKKWPIENS